jgi:hypothetical protein
MVKQFAKMAISMYRVVFAFGRKQPEWVLGYSASNYHTEGILAFWLAW